MQPASPRDEGTQWRIPGVRLDQLERRSAGPPGAYETDTRPLDRVVDDPAVPRPANRLRERSRDRGDRADGKAHVVKTHAGD